MSARAPARAPTSTAPLLYWLVVVAGLAGYSVLRARAPGLRVDQILEDVGPVWMGTVGGVALGQLLAFLRVRAWVPAVALLGASLVPGLALLSIFTSYLSPDDRELAWRATVAFAPAAISGYLSLSERGALVAFWYPTTLWMVAILDGQTSAEALDRGAAAPFIVGLGVLFVAFLRARETRRAAIWRREGSVTIAASRARSVMRASPVRSASEHLGVALVGCGGLVLAAWIAPQLWQVQATERSGAHVAASAPASASVSTATPVPCEALYDDEPRKATRVREYFPLRREVEAEKDLLRRASTPCVPSAALSTADLAGYESYGWGDDEYGAVGYSHAAAEASGGGGVAPSAAPVGYASGYEPAPSVAPPHASPPLAATPVVSPSPPLAAAPTVAVASAPALKPAPVAALKPPPVPALKPAPAQEPRAAHGGAPAVSPSPSPATVATAAAPPSPSAPLRDAGAPWKWTLALSGAALGLHLAGRAARRAILLRHLSSPFWSETVDQRVSNHWERALIALRDAGIAPLADEAPTAFAKRVGVAGLASCAEILERVRHGVGVEPLDLETMARSSAAVFEAAQRRAGALARALAWVRPPG